MICHRNVVYFLLSSVYYYYVSCHAYLKFTNNPDNFILPQCNWIRRHNPYLTLLPPIFRYISPCLFAVGYQYDDVDDSTDGTIRAGVIDMQIFITKLECPKFRVELTENLPQYMEIIHLRQNSFLYHIYIRK